MGFVDVTEDIDVNGVEALGAERGPPCERSPADADNPAAFLAQEAFHPLAVPEDRQREKRDDDQDDDREVSCDNEVCVGHLRKVADLVVCAKTEAILVSPGEVVVGL